MRTIFHYLNTKNEKQGLQALPCTMTSCRFEGVLIWEEKLLIFFGLGVYGCQHKSIAKAFLRLPLPYNCLFPITFLIQEAAFIIWLTLKGTYSSEAAN